MARPTTILLNGAEAGTKDRVGNQDHIELLFGKDGTDASATVRDLVEAPEPIHYQLDGVTRTVTGEILLNGKTVTMDTEIADRDELTVNAANRIRDAITSHVSPGTDSFTVTWNGTTPPSEEA